MPLVFAGIKLRIDKIGEQIRRAGNAQKLTDLILKQIKLTQT